MQVRDIGPMTVEAWKELMRLSRGLVWNDVLGKVEDPQFSQGRPPETVSLESFQCVLIVLMEF